MTLEREMNDGKLREKAFNLYAGYNGEPVIKYGRDPEYTVRIPDPEEAIRELTALVPEWRKAKLEKAKRNLQDAEKRIERFAAEPG